MSKWFFDIFTILYVHSFLFLAACSTKSLGVLFLKKMSFHGHSVSLIYLMRSFMSLRPCSFRYKENRRILQEGMKNLGFEEFLGPEHDGYIITSYKYPKDPNFDFKTFYSKLNEKGILIVSISTCLDINLNNF